MKKYKSDCKLDHSHEVVLETRPFDCDISIETITKLCAIQNVDVDTEPKSISQSKKKNRMMPFYVCRYKLVRSSDKYVLVPVLGEIRKESSASVRKSVSKRKLVSPIKITRNGVEKITRSQSHESIGSDVENVSPNKRSKRITEIIESPVPARRNLNDSFGTDGTTATPDILNYSIVSSKTPTTNDINICLRVSHRQKFVNPKYEPLTESPLSRKRTSVVEEHVHKTPEKSAKKATEEHSAKTPTTSRIRTRRASLAVPESIPTTPPSKRISTRRSSVTCTTPSTLMHPRRSILKTPNKGQAVETTPKKRLTLSHIVEELTQDGRVTRTPTRSCKKNKTGGYYMDDIPATPPSEEKRKSTSTGRTPKKTMTPKQMRPGELTPSIHARSQPVNRRRSQLEVARESLHVSALLKSLPCRENEFDNVYRFVEGKLLDKCGGCMYISGVPGTGKTATVTQAMKALKKSADTDELPEFEFIEINGMRLTEPRQAYVQIYKQLTGKTLAWEQAHNLLEKRFITPAPRRVTTVLLVDELDILCNRRQDVVYNLLDWPSKSNAQLVVITIANTMDLPERLLMGKVASRLGLTRLTFQPYTHKQLQEIVTTRLAGTKAFESDAIQLVARKVASVSGDARRALDICRRATEVAELDSKETGKTQLVTMLHVQKAVQEMIASVKVLAIKSFSKLEQIFLQAVAAEVSK